MNPQLSHQMAQVHQQDLHRASEKARMVRTVSGQSRYSALRRGIRHLGIGHGRPQTNVGTARSVAGDLA